jgi:hypothetical protein
MKGKCYTLACLGVATLFAARLAAQSTSVPAPGAPRCYRLVRGGWSRPLGVNAQYHALPPVIRLDTTPASRGGWTVAPDIAFPTPNRFPGTPRWTVRADSLEILWSNGFQVTTVRLDVTDSAQLRGTVSIGSDANEFGSNPPHATILARRVSCAELPGR